MGAHGNGDGPYIMEGWGPTQHYYYIMDTRPNVNHANMKASPEMVLRRVGAVSRDTLMRPRGRRGRSRVLFHGSRGDLGGPSGRGSRDEMVFRPEAKHPVLAVPVDMVWGFANHPNRSSAAKASLDQKYPGKNVFGKWPFYWVTSGPAPIWDYSQIQTHKTGYNRPVVWSNFAPSGWSVRKHRYDREKPGAWDSGADHYIFLAYNPNKTAKPNP